MQKRKFFFKRFLRYLGMLAVPVIFLILIACILLLFKISGEMDRKGKDVLGGVDSSIELSLNNIMLQNRQFANNPYTVLSLKRMLDGDYLEYRDTLNLRTIRATVRSSILTYSYISSIYLYLDGYDKFLSSGNGIEKIDKNKDEWVSVYHDMPENTERFLFVSEDKKELFVFQRLLLQKGIVVMSIDLDQYYALMEKSIGSNSGALLFYNSDDQLLFTRGDAYNAAEFVDLSEIPTEDKNALWLKVGSKYYLGQQKNNSIYNVRIISLMPFEYMIDRILVIMPYLLIILVAAVFSIMIMAYLTTKKNFLYIENVINTLEKAEKGEITEKNNDVIVDEYDAILSNVIELHLRTEMLNKQLGEKKNAQDIATLVALQTQINPHFLFNTLQQIRIKAMQESEAGDRSDTAQMTENLAEILKYALSDPLEPIKLSEEIDYLKKYIEIQKIRFGDSFIIYYELDERLEDFHVFRLMLQPIIENSISHGIRPSGKKGYIKLKVFRRQNMVIFRVFDTGIGMEKEELNKLMEQIKSRNYHNVGLSNVNNRLILYFGENSALHIMSRPNRGTVVEFAIPEDGIKKYVT